jgi:hypothetical protein
MEQVVVLQEGVRGGEDLLSAQARAPSPMLSTWARSSSASGTRREML